MIPNKALLLGAGASSVAPPKNQMRYKLEDKAFGGVDIQDPSAGVLYQLWTAHYDIPTGQVWLKAENGINQPALTLHGITELGLAFDNNANWILGYRIANGLGFVSYYSDATLGRVVQPLGAITSIMVSIDDARGISIGNTDVLVTYITPDRKLWVNGQREKYQSPHLMIEGVPADEDLVNFGMGNAGRIQWVTSNQYLRDYPP